MKKIFYLFFIGSCFLMACHKNSTPAPSSPSKPLQIVVSNITSTLTIYSFSVTEQSSSNKLITVYSQTENETYNVNVKSGDVLKLNYFLELEGPSPVVEPVVSFVYDGVTMASVANRAGIVSGEKYITIP
ncbi:MAG: hypothetical protein ACXVB0_10460 [Mucilaginibacter sp.]